MDALAKENGWEVAESSSGTSVYKRLADTVVLEFDDAGEFTGGEHVRDIKIEGKLWKGHVGNILRHRYRSVIHE